tara:strand:- start:304 stop:420 length:117 start_codon:yes stop_codon:yes gene_type:complete
MLSQHDRASFNEKVACQFWLAVFLDLDVEIDLELRFRA